jgi:hypothetical protein
MNQLVFSFLVHPVMFPCSPYPGVAYLPYPLHLPAALGSALRHTGNPFMTWLELIITLAVAVFSVEVLGDARQIFCGLGIQSEYKSSNSFSSV